MTPLDVVFRYGRTPGPLELQAINYMRAVYRIRRVHFDENNHTIRVEYDASRLTEAEVATLLRYAGVESKEKASLRGDGCELRRGREVSGRQVQEVGQQSSLQIQKLGQG